MTQLATPRPTVTGPVTAGHRGWAFGASTLDVAARGYTEAEYLLEGTATRYKLAPGAELTRDGHWKVEPAGEAPFKTRMLVYRPTDSARFNGTVIVTWNNVTAGYDLFSAESLEIFEAGFALVCVTTQKVGIEGLPPEPQGRSHPVLTDRLGVIVQPVGAGRAKELGLDGVGLVVERAVADTYAHLLGVKAGDVLILLDGIELRTSADIERAMRARSAADDLTLVWLDELGQRHERTWKSEPRKR